MALELLLLGARGWGIDFGGLEGILGRCYPWIWDIWGLESVLLRIVISFGVC
jgi:hypothetical protein